MGAWTWRYLSSLAVMLSVQYDGLNPEPTMSIHAKRAAIVVVLVTMFTVVRVARPLLMGLGSGHSVRFVASFGLGETLLLFVAPAVFIGGLAYWLSKRSSRRPTARR
jgi:hypothetical protein